jgi:hypothetical protein
MSKKFTIPCALDKLNNQVLPDNVTKEENGPFHCILCKREVVHVIKSKNGTRAYFRHKPDPKMHCENNKEFFDHKKAILLVRDYLHKYIFVRYCCRCRNSELDKQQFNLIDYKVREEQVVTGDQKVDIAIYNQDNKAIACINLSPLSIDNKVALMAYTNNNCFEVQHKPIIDNESNPQNLIFYDYSHTLMCTRCIDAKHLQEEREKKEEEDIIMIQDTPIPEKKEKKQKAEIITLISNWQIYPVQNIPECIHRIDWEQSKRSIERELRHNVFEYSNEFICRDCQLICPTCKSSRDYVKQLIVYCRCDNCKY